MGWPSVAVSAAVFAPAVRIDAGLKTDIRTLVASNDGLSVVLKHLRPNVGRRSGIAPFIDIIMQRLEPVYGIDA